MTKYDFEDIMTMLIRDFRVEDNEESRDVIEQALLDAQQENESS